MSLMSDIGAAIKNKLMVNDFASQSSNLLTGGGTVSVSAAWEVKWSTRFITISNGKGTGLATNGYFDITMPAAATVITGVGGATNKTVTANGIPIVDWETLYYILPVGGAAGTVNANFRVVNYTADVTIPSTWVKICSRNSEGPYIDFSCGVSLRNNTSINTNLYDVKGADVDGAVSSANTLATARTIQTNLASTSNASFNGSANITPGVTGTLAVGNGGTGVTTSTGSGSVVLSTSPALTGTPTAPTAASGTNTTQIATTAFVASAIGDIDAALNTINGVVI